MQRAFFLPLVLAAAVLLACGDCRGAAPGETAAADDWPQ